MNASMYPFLSLSFFLGAKIQELEQYVMPHLNAQKPDMSVI